MTALIQISVNDAVPLPASTDVVVHDVAYTEGPSDVNHVGNGSFAGLDGWGPYGEGAAVVVPGGGLRVTASADQVVNVDSAPFSIEPGASFRFSFSAEVPAASADTTRVSLIFIGDAGVESSRVAEVLRPTPMSLGESVTDASGTATLTAQELAAGRYRIRVTQPGNLNLWPAYADTEITVL